MPYCHFDLDSYVRAAVCEPGLRNGVIASKLFWFQLEKAREQLAPDLSISDAFNRLLEICGRLQIVRLIRQDKIRQAISYTTAYKTGVWSVRREDEICSGQVDSHNFLEIDLWSRKLLEWEGRWDELLAERRSDILTISYEEVRNSIEVGARTIAAHMGFDVCASRIGAMKSAIVRQSDEEAVDRTVAAFRKWQACVR